MENNEYASLEGCTKHRKTSLKSLNITSIQQNILDTQQKNRSFMVQKSMSTETFILFKLSSQIGFTFMLEGFLAYISIPFLGQLQSSSQIISAFAMANSLSHCFVIFPIFGLSSGLWTLIPQFIGSNQIHLIALSVQRAFCICFICQIPLCITLFYSKTILQFIGTNTDSSIDWNIIQNCCYVQIAHSFGFWISSILQRVAQSMNLSFQITVIVGVTFGISITLNYLAVIYLEFGYMGAVICRELSLFIYVILTVLMLIHEGYSFIFKPLPFRQIFHSNGIYEYLRLSVPSGIQVVLQWLPKTFLGLLIGSLNDATVAVSVHYVMKTLNKPELFHNGVGSACAIRIGKYIGANSIVYAKRCVKIQIIYELALMIFFYIIYSMFRYEIPKLITNDTKVSSFVSNQLIYVSLFNLFNRAIYANVVPIYRALGYSKTSVYVSLTAQYLIAYPICLYLLFSNTYHYSDHMETGVYVVWICDSVGFLLAHLSLIFILIHYIDWNNAVEESNLRIKLNSSNLSSMNAIKTNNNNGKISRSL